MSYPQSEPDGRPQFSNNPTSRRLDDPHDSHEQAWDERTEALGTVVGPQVIPPSAEPSAPTRDGVNRRRWLAVGAATTVLAGGTGVLATTRRGESIIATVKTKAARIISNEKVIEVDDYGAKGDGETDDTAAIRAALTELGTNAGTLVFGPGTYKSSATITLGPYQSVIGSSKGATVIRYSGSGDAVYARDTLAFGAGADGEGMLQSMPGGSPGVSRPTNRGVGGPRWGGVIENFTIDGRDAGPNTTGLRIGDLFGSEVNIGVINFDGPSGKGIYFNNQTTWFEQGTVRALIQNCKEGAVFHTDIAGGAGSSNGYSEYDFYILADCDQTMVRCSGHTVIYNLRGSGFTLGGNAYNNAGAGGDKSSNSGVVLDLRDSTIFDGFGGIQVEANGDSGFLGHQTINVGPDAALYFDGRINFLNGNISFRNGTGPNSVTALYGHMNIDDLFGRMGASQHALRAIGGMTGWRGHISEKCEWYPFSGNWFDATLSAGPQTFEIKIPEAIGKSEGGSWDVFLRQPGSGSTTINWPSNIVWSSGSEPKLSTENGAVDWIRISTPDFATYYAEHVNAKPASPEIAAPKHVRAEREEPTSESPFRAKTTVPPASDSPGRPGQWAADGDFVYMYAGNGDAHLWVRAKTSTW